MVCSIVVVSGSAETARLSKATKFVVEKCKKILFWSNTKRLSKCVSLFVVIGSCTMAIWLPELSNTAIEKVQLYEETVFKSKDILTLSLQAERSIRGVENSPS